MSSRDAAVELDGCPPSPPTLRQWLASEPFTLVMSSGFFAFYAHTGFLSVLEEEGLLPAAIGGASAGALVSGMWAAGLSAQAFWDELRTITRQDFWDPQPGFGLLAGARFEARLRQLLPVQRFDACRVPLHVSLYDVRARRTVVQRSGELAPALHASCSVPLLFQPVRIDGRAYLDGGVADRPGLEGVAVGARTLYHHIESRSAWRRRKDLQIPERQNLTTLVLGDLPRSGPFALPRGRDAFHVARAKTRRALDLPLAGALLRV